MDHVTSRKMINTAGPFKKGDFFGGSQRFMKLRWESKTQNRLFLDPQAVSDGLSTFILKERSCFKIENITR